MAEEYSWNFRAAMVLDWSYSQAEQGFMHLPEEHGKFLLKQGFCDIEVIDEGHLQFEECRDWAWLLLDFLNWSELADFCEYLSKDREIKTIGGFIAGRRSHFPREIWRSSAKQITIAAVKVLEARKSAEKSEISDQKEKTSD